MFAQILLALKPKPQKSFWCSRITQEMTPRAADLLSYLWARSRAPPVHRVQFVRINDLILLSSRELLAAAPWALMKTQF